LFYLDVDRELDDESNYYFLQLQVVGIKCLFVVDMKTTVERMIEQEMRRMKRVERSDLPLNIDLFEKDELLKQEIERIQKK
jgi:hypothetical protein